MEGSRSPASTGKRLVGKVAIITGGASGIGEATARLFVQHGAKVVIADIQQELGQNVSKSIESETGQHVPYVHCNVADESDMANAVETAVSEFGKLDIMFSNAGIIGNYNLSIASLTREDFLKVFDVNVYGAFLAAKHASKVMIEKGTKGCILFTSSTAGVSYSGSSHAYTASKHALIGLSKNLAVELGRHGIRVNCISPGGIPTPLSSKALGDVDLRTVQELISMMAALKGVFPETNDIAEAALYLGSDFASFVTGANLVVDGGFCTIGLGKIPTAN